MVTRRLRTLAASGLMAGCAAIATLFVSAPVHAETRWEMATEYPESAMPGLGVSSFARHLDRLSGNAVTTKPSYDAAAGIKSAAMLTAVAEKKIAAGDAFASALEAENPIFALPALPFLVTSIADAKRLAQLARPYLAAVLKQRGVRLLYLTPWPPSGIWSKTPLHEPGDLARLSVRTYDGVSRAVMSGVGAKAFTISFADTMPKLADGSLDAVLSSGDGGAGRKLWQFLPNFTEIVYALPLSIAFVNLESYDALSPAEKAAVDAAAAATEADLWIALDTRLEENYAVMRKNGVVIDAHPQPALIDALKASAVPVQKAWCDKAGPVCAELLGKFRETP